MKKVVVAAAAVALAAPPVAAAKELTKLQVCGASGCASITDRSTLRKIGEGSNGETTAPTPRLQRYYRVTATIEAEHGGQFTTFYLPAANLTRGINPGGYAQWFPASREYARAIAGLGVRPFPKPHARRVLIGGREAAGPATYARLLTLKAPEAPVSAATDWVTVSFRFTRPTPWSSDATTLEFSPSTGYLYRDGKTLDLPDGLASKIRARRSLSSDGGANVAYVFGGGLGGAAFLAVGAAVLTRRRRPR